MHAQTYAQNEEFSHDHGLPFKIDKACSSYLYHKLKEILCPCMRERERERARTNHLQKSEYIQTRNGMKEGRRGKLQFLGQKRKQILAQKNIKSKKKKKKKKTIGVEGNEMKSCKQDKEDQGGHQSKKSNQIVIISLLNQTIQSLIQFDFKLFYDELIKYIV